MGWQKVYHQLLACRWGWQTVCHRLTVCRLGRQMACYLRMAWQQVRCSVCRRERSHCRLRVCHLVLQMACCRLLPMAWRMACCLGWMVLGCRC